MCIDWRSTARRRFAAVTEGSDPREEVNVEKEDRRLQEHKQQVRASHLYHRATGGQPLTSESRSRAEEVTMNKLRLNRAPFLQATKHGHRQMDKPSARTAKEKKRTQSTSFYTVLRGEMSGGPSLEKRQILEPSDGNNRRYGLPGEHWGLPAVSTLDGLHKTTATGHLRATFRK